MNGTLHHVSFFLHTRKTTLAVFAQKLHGTQKMKEARGGVQHVVLVVAGTDRGINLFEQHQPFLMRECSAGEISCGLLKPTLKKAAFAPSK